MHHDSDGIALTINFFFFGNDVVFITFFKLTTKYNSYSLKSVQYECFNRKATDRDFIDRIRRHTF